jgi:hypothetical protein
VRGCAWLVVGVVTWGCGFKPSPINGSDDAMVGDAKEFHDAPVDQKITPLLDAYECSTNNFTCPNQFVKIKTTCNNGCWVGCQSTSAFTSETQVATLCTNWGGKLAPIRDVNDEACVAQVIFPSQASWIGFEQASGQSSVSAGWSWNSDAMTPAYTNWDNGQPNDQNGSENGQEQCAFMTTSGGWQDVDCGDNTFYRFSCRHD